MPDVRRPNPLAFRADGPEGAPVVVLLHPIGATSELWAPQRPVFAQRFRVLSVDLPGHGGSEHAGPGASLDDFAAAVAATLDAAGVRQAAVVGLSIGGMVAQGFALAWPERTTALVLAHTLAHANAQIVQVWETRIAELRLNGVESQVEATLQRWFTPQFQQAAPLTVDWVRAIIRRADAKGLEGAMDAIRGLDYLDRLNQIRVPTLVITGRSDQAATPAVAETIAAAISGARTHLLDSRHIGNVEQPVAFTEVVGGFLSAALAG